ncbi:MarR family winged helix-turn-helix transcriptional regulator [Peptoniphilus stercorisuis]|uniref:DNA-binding MarR family transcriptional regulator n=1 Tax=Peptoniphilus stercorisuis TaxID=1436965 RepID=A0ABS4KAB0_9FIRM|nr:MarR family transcriptional regulator [Peptoniphilus stercorisuis]MBP2024683.1 DNA-binding MarR family transcriptional regulator [Peptoniphilus stercorisuis]
MVEEIFSEVYDKFKLNFYRNIFQGFAKREASLTATETFCVEVIYALDRPTINQLGRFLELSQPNIAYKVNNLVKKGYVKKIQSKEDKREFFLEVTDKFHNYYDIKNEYMKTVLERAREKFSKEEMAQFEYILKVMSEELMPEITEGMKKD